MIAAASVIFFVFLVGAFAVVERTGALGRLVNSLASSLEGRGLLVIPVAGLAFATGGVLIQMQEELIAFVRSSSCSPPGWASIPSWRWR